MNKNENCSTYSENNSTVLRPEPDVIIRQPITAQPLMTSTGSPLPWALNPCGAAPVDRPSSQATLASRLSQVRITETKGTVSVSLHSGSRDWSKNLFDSFKEVHTSKRKCSAITNLCLDCLCMPCMMSNVASSLGDKPYLPFIPGTGAAIRFKVRILGGIQGSIADDCLVTCCCCPCATCQMHQEIEDIGLGVTW